MSPLAASATSLKATHLAERCVVAADICEEWRELIFHRSRNWLLKLPDDVFRDWQLFRTPARISRFPWLELMGSKIVHVSPVLPLFSVDIAYSFAPSMHSNFD
jgi:hypothetical protein